MMRTALLLACLVAATVVPGEAFVVKTSQTAPQTSLAAASKSNINLEASIKGFAAAAALSLAIFANPAPSFADGKFVMFAFPVV